MRRIGFFGGSFDPIHFGHISLAFEMLEKQKLDTILFCPANINPNKNRDYPPLPIEKRMKMIELAIGDIPQFQMTDIEAKRGGVSYTVDTITELKQQNPDDQFFIILGLDTLKDFDKWKNPKEIFSLASPLIGLRDCDQVDPNAKYYSFFEKGFIKTKRFDISSTEIRERILNGQYIRHLMPSKVVDYIYENGLY